MRIQPGAIRFVPALKSNAAPTATVVTDSARKTRSASASCLGVPSPNQTMLAPLSRIVSSCALISSGVCSRKGGECDPHIRNPGKRASADSLSFSKVSGVLPKRKCPTSLSLPRDKHRSKSSGPRICVQGVELTLRKRRILASGAPSAKLMPSPFRISQYPGVLRAASSVPAFTKRNVFAGCSVADSSIAFAASCGEVVAIGTPAKCLVSTGSLAVKNHPCTYCDSGGLVDEYEGASSPVLRI